MTKYNKIQNRRLDMKDCLKYLKNSKQVYWEGICDNLSVFDKDFFQEKYITPWTHKVIGKVPYLAQPYYEDKKGTFGREYSFLLCTLEDYLMYVCNIPREELTFSRMRQYRINFIKWILKNDPDYGGKIKK